VIPEAPEPGPDGAVHYQISITARQAAAFFVVLLLSLGLAFFFGMKTGAAAKRAGDPATRLAAASDLPVPTAVPIEEPAEKPDEDRKLGFEKTKPTPAEKTSVSEPPRTEPEEPRPTVTPVPPKPTPEPKPTKAEKPAAEKAAAEKAPVKPAAEKPGPEKAAAEKAPVKPAAEKPGPEKAAADRSPAPRKEAWFVQVFATKSVAAAEKLSERLKAAKLRSDVSTDPSGSGVYRVRVGPYAEKAQAEAAKKKVLEIDRSLKDAKLVHP
jgi:outer membrane biosynthesis protein TonB